MRKKKKESDILGFFFFIIFSRRKNFSCSHQALLSNFLYMTDNNDALPLFWGGGNVFYSESLRRGQIKLCKLSFPTFNLLICIKFKLAIMIYISELERRNKQIFLMLAKLIV